MNRPSEVDVRHLPEWVFDYRAPVWWGNVCLIGILTMFTMLTLGSYFYLAKDFQDWPPPQSNVYPPILRPLPPLWPGTLVLAILLVSCVPAALADRRARSMQQWPMRLGLTLTSVAGLGALYLRYAEFQHLPVRWDDNAYGSILWAILALHLLFNFIAIVEMLLMTSWCWLFQLDEKHAFQTTIVCFFWYWNALIWIPSYLVVYWSPRI